MSGTPSNLGRHDLGHYELSLEFAALRQPSNCPQGVYMLPDESDVYTWHGVIFVHRGYYAGGVFRFTLVFPPNYPGSAPQVYFPPTLLHPLVDPNSGRLLLASRFPSGWRPREHFVSHLLFFIKNCFKRAVLDSLRESLVVNAEVFRMYRENPTLFAKLAAQCATLSVSPSSLYDHTSSSAQPGALARGVSFSGSGSAHVRRTSANESGGQSLASGHGVRFAKLSKEMDQVRKSIFGDDVDVELGGGEVTERTGWIQTEARSRSRSAQGSDYSL